MAIITSEELNVTFHGCGASYPYVDASLLTRDVSITDNLNKINNLDSSFGIYVPKNSFKVLDSVKY